MGLILTIGLLVSLTGALVLCLVPQGVYDVTPAAAAGDIARRRINAWLVKDKEMILETIGKSAADIVKTGILTGVMFAMLGFLLSVKFIGPFALIAGVAFFFLGVLITQKVMKNEFRRWQESLYEGVPQLVNFVPAFLEIKGVTAREAIGYTIPFLPNPFRQEMWQVLDRIKRTARVKEALDELALKAGNPVVDAICFRLSANWDADISPDIFDDLQDQIEDMNNMLVTKETTAKTAYLALICVLGLMGVMMIFGYPGIRYMLQQLTGGLGM